ncbi:MAG: hypothetical protein Q7V01_08800, partial [Vicinamibacterales bacterium]|nr:hypothetical protein [Vicinamibacterales bacterium]
MKAENIVFAVAGTLFGLIAGWILGTQQAPARPAAGVVQSASAPTPAAPARPMLDEGQVTAMRNVADRDPQNVESRVQLGNLYFDAE